MTKPKPRHSLSAGCTRPKSDVPGLEKNDQAQAQNQAKAQAQGAQGLRERALTSGGSVHGGVGRVRCVRGRVLRFVFGRGALSLCLRGYAKA